MSDNKYIIDEDSLVGIANVIRDKLGVGTGIDDDEAGYYSEQTKILEFTQPQDRAAYSGPGSGYTGNWFIYCSVSDIENISGIRPSYVRVTLPTTGSTSARISRFYPTTSTIVASANFTNGVAILSLPADIDNYYLRYEVYYSSYSSQTQYMTIPSFDVAFLDENQEVIDISDYSGKSFLFSRVNSARNFSTSTKSIAIPYSIDDIQDKITNYLEKPTLNIDYQGLSYGYIAIGSNASEFYSYNNKNSYLTFIPLTSGQKIGFCIGETVSNMLRAGFFQGKVYSDFQQYVNQYGYGTKVVGNGVLVTGSSDLSGNGLLKRFYYTAPSDGELVVMTSNNSTSAPIHVWRA